MRLILGFLLFLSAHSVYATNSDAILSFPKLNVKLHIHWTQGPYVVKESFMKLSVADLQSDRRSNEKMNITISLIPLDQNIKAPKTEVHDDYTRTGQLQVSRIFFTAGGRWRLKVAMQNSDKVKQESYVDIFVENQNSFPKDTETFPYAGKIAHKKVGMLGGTGCRRRWDFVDTHDSTSVNMPYDLCGKYAMVSTRYQKWIDLSVYGDHSEKINIWPIKGDAVLEPADCRNRSEETWKLIHHPVCGDKGKIIAYCDRAGNAVSCTEN